MLLGIPELVSFFFSSRRGGFVKKMPMSVVFFRGSAFWVGFFKGHQQDTICVGFSYLRHSNGDSGFQRRGSGRKTIGVGVILS